jgi:hypothetical protein
MIEGYETKDIKATKNKMEAPEPSRMTPPKDKEEGEIFEEDGLYYFKWKGGMCGFATKENAEIGLLKSSGKFKEEA